MEILKNKKNHSLFSIILCVLFFLSGCKEEFDLNSALEKEKYILRYLDSKGSALENYADFNAERKESTKLIDENVAPSEACMIGVFDSTGNYLRSVGLGNLKHQHGKKLYSFGLMSDIHIGYENAEANLEKTLEFINNYGVKFIACLGDIPTYGNHEAALTTYSGYLSSDGKFDGIPVYTICGNHENNAGIIADSLWLGKTHMSAKHVRIDYSVENGETHHLVCLSCCTGDGPWQDRLGSFFDSAALDWLDLQLSACSSDKTFVLCHPCLPDKANYGYNYSPKQILNDLGTSYAKELTRIRSAISSHSNTVWFMGHTHEEWAKQGVAFTNSDNAKVIYERGEITATQLEKGDNLDANISPYNCSRNRDVGWCVHVPANYKGEFAVVDVYRDCIIIKGVSNGKFLPIAQYDLSLE